MIGEVSSEYFKSDINGKLCSKNVTYNSPVEHGENMVLFAHYHVIKNI